MNDRRAKHQMHSYKYMHVRTHTHNSGQPNISPQPTTKNRNCINQSNLPTTIEQSIGMRSDASY